MKPFQKKAKCPFMPKGTGVRAILFGTPLKHWTQERELEESIEKAEVKELVWSVGGVGHGLDLKKGDKVSTKLGVKWRKVVMVI